MGVKNSKYYMENGNIYLRKSNTPSYIANGTKEKVEIKNHDDGKVTYGYYHGYFRNDTFNGKGRLEYDNVTYKGEFVDGKFTGRGKKIVKNCRSHFPLYDGVRVGDITYEGYFVDGKLNGRGVLRKNNYDGVKEYIGTSKWSNGNYKRMIDKYTYEGEFVNDVFVEGKIYIGGKSSYIYVNRDNFANDIINGFVLWQRTPYKFSAMYIRNNKTKKMITYMYGFKLNNNSKRKIKIIYKYDPPNYRKYDERTYENMFNSLADNEYLLINFAKLHNEISDKIKGDLLLPRVNVDDMKQERKEEIKFLHDGLQERVKVYDVNNLSIDRGGNLSIDRSKCILNDDSLDVASNIIYDIATKPRYNENEEDILRLMEPYASKNITLIIAPELFEESFD